jgi:hypothetical protein
VLERLDTPAAATAELRAVFAGNAAVDRLVVALLAAYLGDQQLALDALRDDVLLPTHAHHIWRPIFRELRQREDFKGLLRDEGFVAYWQEFGWPDLCRPAGSDDFVCD